MRNLNVLPVIWKTQSFFFIVSNVCISIIQTCSYDLQQQPKKRRRKKKDENRHLRYRFHYYNAYDGPVVIQVLTLQFRLFLTPFFEMRFIYNTCLSVEYLWSLVIPWHLWRWSEIIDFDFVLFPHVVFWHNECQRFK